MFSSVVEKQIMNSVSAKCTVRKAGYANDWKDVKKVLVHSAKTISLVTCLPLHRCC